MNLILMPLINVIPTIQITTPTSFHPMPIQEWLKIFLHKLYNKQLFLFKKFLFKDFFMHYSALNLFGS